MLITYWIDHNKHHAIILSDHVKWIEKMKSVGADKFMVYEAACTCNAGMLEICDTPEPCTECRIGREYDRLFNPKKYEYDVF